MFEKINKSNITIEQVGDKVAFSYQFTDEKKFALATGRIALRDKEEWSVDKKNAVITLTTKLKSPATFAEIDSLFEELVQ